MKTWIRAVLGISLSAAATLGASSANAAPAPPIVYPVGYWLQGDVSATRLADTTNYFCYLTYVTGRYAGGGESVHVYASDGYWYVGGSSAQQGVEAGATCVDYAAFLPESGAVNWTQSFGEYWPDPTGWPMTINTWLGDSALMLSGITGEFNGGGETVTAGQAGSAAAYNVLSTTAGSTNGAGGWAQTLFLGIPNSGFEPSFYGPYGGPTTANAAGEYIASSGAGKNQGVVPMVSALDGICYFTEIGGAFGGTGESVSIDRENNVWVLRVSSQQPNGTFAHARCYAFNQSRSLAQ
jgi:hypothetical protein